MFKENIPLEQTLILSCELNRYFITVIGQVHKQKVVLTETT